MKLPTVQELREIIQEKGHLTEEPGYNGVWVPISSVKN